MAFQVRRVITGNDMNGRAVVKIDGVSKHVFASRRGTAERGHHLKNGTIFRVIEFSPGVTAREHRTDSIDYIVAMSGEIDMELDDSVVHLSAGDVMVQRGTIHNWVDRGTEPCVLAVVLVDAKPACVGGKTL